MLGPLLLRKLTTGKSGLLLASFLAIAILTLLVLDFSNKLNKKTLEVERLESNIVSYKETLEYSGKEKTALRLTISELKRDTSELITTINKYKKELKIKDRELRNVIYTKTALEAQLQDSITAPEMVQLQTSLALDKTISPNELTSVQVVIKDSLLRVNLDIQDKLYIYHYQKMTWKEPNFWKRLFLFRWKKKADNKYNLKNENFLIEIKETQFITIEEE